MVTLRSSRKNTGLGRTEVPLSQLGRNRGTSGLAGVTVSIANPSDAVYIRGSEFVDGSIRLIPNIARGICTVQKRENGVWNATEFEVGEGSLFLGSNLSLTGIGESVEVRSIEGSKRFLLLDIAVNDSGTVHPRVPAAGQRIPRIILQPDDSAEALLTSHIREVTIIPQTAGFGFSFFFRIGAISPIDEVLVQLTLGHAPGGALLFERLYPASDFLSNTEVQLVLSGGVGLQTGELALITVSSTTAFSMKGDAGGEIFFGLDFQPVTHEDLVSENSIFDNNLNHVLDLTLDPTYTTPVFS